MNSFAVLSLILSALFVGVAGAVAHIFRVFGILVVGFTAVGCAIISLCLFLLEVTTRVIATVIRVVFNVSTYLAIASVILSLSVGVVVGFFFLALYMVIICIYIIDYFPVYVFFLLGMLSVILCFCYSSEIFDFLSPLVRRTFTSFFLKKSLPYALRSAVDSLFLRFSNSVMAPLILFTTLNAKELQLKIQNTAVSGTIFGKAVILIYTSILHVASVLSTAKNFVWGFIGRSWNLYKSRLITSALLEAAILYARKLLQSSGMCELRYVGAMENGTQIVVTDTEFASCRLYFPIACKVLGVTGATLCGLMGAPDYAVRCVETAGCSRFLARLLCRILHLVLLPVACFRYGASLAIRLCYLGLRACGTVFITALYFPAIIIMFFFVAPPALFLVQLVFLAAVISICLCACPIAAVLYIFAILLATPIIGQMIKGTCLMLTCGEAEVNIKNYGFAYMSAYLKAVTSAFRGWIGPLITEYVPVFLSPSLYFSIFRNGIVLIKSFSILIVWRLLHWKGAGALTELSREVLREYWACILHPYAEHEEDRVTRHRAVFLPIERSSDISHVINQSMNSMQLNSLDSVQNAPKKPSQSYSFQVPLLLVRTPDGDLEMGKLVQVQRKVPLSKSMGVPGYGTNPTDGVDHQL